LIIAKRPRRYDRPSAGSLPLRILKKRCSWK
jgi:hypothetical protein